MDHPLDTSRREFLRRAVTTATVAGVGVSGTSTLSATESNEQAPLEGYPFNLGVASGDPLPDSVVLWTRLATEPLSADGGMPDIEVAVQWKIATEKENEDEGDDDSPFDEDFPFGDDSPFDEDFPFGDDSPFDEEFPFGDDSPFDEDFPFGDDSPFGNENDDGEGEEEEWADEIIGEDYRVVHTDAVFARPQYAHSVHIDVKGLDPDTEYNYQFKIGPHLSPVGKTNTVPAEGADVDELTFAFASCQSLGSGYYTAHDHLADEDLDLAIHLGDYIYEGEITSLDGYRKRYAQYKSDPNLQDVHAAFPWVVTWDDHEVENNYADEDSAALPSEEFLERRANAYQAYFEHQPLRPERMPDGPNLPLYRRFTFGDLAEFNILDTRQYRDDQANSVEAAKSPSRTILGDEQEDWLVDGLNDSTSRWNVLANQVVFAATDENPNPDVRNFGAGDKWDGYRADRETLLDVMAADSDLNPVVITGDIHRNYAYNLKADFSDPDSEIVGTEYVGTSISSFGDGSGRTLLGSSEGEPWRRFFNDERGYVLCTLTPDEWKTDYRVVSTIEEPTASVSTVASFVTEAGNPGATLDGIGISEVETEPMSPGIQSQLSVSLINPTSEVVETEVTIKLPDGWSSTNPSKELALTPSSSEVVEVPVTPLPSLGLGDEEYLRETLEVTLEAEGVNAYGSPRDVEVLVLPDPEGPNIAPLAQLAASSTLPGFPVSRVTDGVISSANWLATTWVDATQGVFPDTVTLQFSEPHQIGRVDLYTIGSDQFPAPVWGLRAYNIQLLVNGEWQTVANVRNNENNPVISTFEPVTTTAVRIRTLASNNGVNSPIVELEVYAG